MSDGRLWFLVIQKTTLEAYSSVLHIEHNVHASKRKHFNSY